MTQLFSKYLSLAIGAADAPHETKQIVSTIPKELSAWHEDKVTSVRELLLTTDIGSTTLLQTEFYNTVLEGSQPVKCMRQAIPVFGAKAGTLTVPIGETGTYAPKIAEGAEAVMYNQTYTSRDFTVYKWGDRPMISQEMVDRGLYDVIGLEVAAAGQRLENTLNQEALSVILQNSGLEQDCAEAATAAATLTKTAGAISAVRGAGYNPDTIVVHPEAEALLLEKFTSLNTQVGTDVTLSGKIGTLLGCQVFSTSVSDNSATYAWDFDANGEVGVLVFDSKRAGAIAMEKDIYVEKYNDPVRDLLGCVVRARFGTNYLAANATARVIY